MTLDEWAQTCWGLLAVRLYTLKVYKSQNRVNLSPVFAQRELEQITRREVQSWILSIEAVKGKYALPVLKTLVREAMNYELLENNCMTGVRKKPYQRPERDFLTWQELDSLDFGSYNNLFRFLGSHGLRWSECQALTSSDVSDDLLHVTQSTHGPTKNLQSRVVPYVGYFEDFPCSYSWGRKRLKDVSRVTIHSLRYTYAHALKSSGVHPQVAQRLRAIRP